MSDTHVTGRIVFRLPLEFPSTNNAIILPENPGHWRKDMADSLQSEPRAIALVVEIVDDGTGAVSLTLCPYNERRTAGDEDIGNNLSISLSNENAVLIGRAIIATAQLNPPL